MAVQHRLDLRIHPTFHWHVEEDVFCEYMTGIKGAGTIDWKIGETQANHRGVSFRKLKECLYQIEGYSPDTVMFNGTAIPKDLNEEVLSIISFATALQGETV